MKHENQRMSDAWVNSTEYKEAWEKWSAINNMVDTATNGDYTSVPFESSQEFRDARLAFRKRYSRTKADH